MQSLAAADRGASHSRAPPVGMICVRLLVTRPDPEGEADRCRPARARSRGAGRAVAANRGAADADLGAGPWTGIIMTSSNAARAMAQHPALRRVDTLAGLRGRPAHRGGGAGRGFCRDRVGRRRYRRTHWRDRARRHAADGPLLYLAGADRAADVAGALAAERSAGRHRGHLSRRCGKRISGRRAHGAGDRRDRRRLAFSRRSTEIYLTCAERADLLDKATSPCHIIACPGRWPSRWRRPAPATSRLRHGRRKPPCSI